MKLMLSTRRIWDDLIAIHAAINIGKVVESKSRIVANFRARICGELSRSVATRAAFAVGFDQ